MWKLKAGSLSLLFLFLTTVIGFSVAQSPEAESPIGKTLEKSYVLVDRWGKEQVWTTEEALTVFKNKSPGGYVLLFLKPDCPLVQRYQDTIRKFSAEFAKVNMQVFGIYSDIGVTRLEMAQHKQVADFAFPVFLDVGGELAKAVGATRTPQAFLLDAQRKVLYAGPIDNAGWEGSKELNAVEGEELYLVSAVNRMKRGQPIEVPDRLKKSPGCGLPSHNRRKDPDKVPLKYFPAVERVINKQCTSCHWDGGIGKIVLETYPDANANAEEIARVVKYQRMPPWNTIPMKGHALVDEKMMSDEDRQLIVQWVEDGALQGNPKDSELPAVQRKDPKAFSIGNGKPDLVIEMTEPFLVDPAMKDLDYQFFWVPSAVNRDQWIEEIEVVPGDARVVHHLQLHLKPKSDRGMYLPKNLDGTFEFGKPLNGLNAMSGFYGLSGDAALRVVSYVPGNENNVRRLGPDKAMKIPANYDAIIEVHYTALPDQTVRDQSKVGIVFAKGPPKYELHNAVFFHPKDFVTPAHEPHAKLEHDITFKDDVTILDIRPHRHKRGSDFKVAILPPPPKKGGVRGPEVTILLVPAYEFRWQHTYTFKKPIFLPAGSVLRCTSHDDNSRLNPNHNLSSQRVFWGQRSDQEMSNLVISYIIHKSPDEK